MKYCPVCESKYGDEVELCVNDGATLKLFGARQDPFFGKLIKGRYQVHRKIGEGGMGTVYLAEQVSVGRKVALKLLQGSYASDDDFISRFRREAQLAASLNHRNIVTIYDFDQGNDGTLFIAMEYLAGEKLSDVIRRDGPLDIVRAVRLGIQIAEGLNAAHRAGIIHRDIKSDNIMIVDDDCREDVKIMDFGIARPRDTGTMNQLTRMGMIMGTPAYMAPEQAEGAEVSDKTDIYALGIVLYEMLSGSVPFRATTPGAVLIKQLQEMPVSLRKLRREVPADVERIVMKALQKQPHKRQEHMREMMQDLQKVQSTMIADGGSETLVDTLVVGRTVSKVSSLRGRPLWVALMGVILVAIGLGTSQVATSLWGNLEIKKSTTELGPGAEQAPLSTISENPLVPVSRSSARANADSKRAIEDHMKAAEAFSSSGEYAHALAELRKAKSIASEDEGVQAELTRTKNACLAEQRLGLTKGKCE